MAWFGFGAVNVAQALLFGASHGFLFMGASTGLTPIGSFAIVLLPAVQGWLMGG